MVSLVDIGTLSDKVTLRGKEVEVTGVSVSVVVDLLANSDELRRLFAEKALDGDMVQALIAQAPLAVAQFIAAGTGKPRDEATIEFAYRQLTAGETYMIVKPMLSMTFPQGLNSFIEELTALARKAEERGWVAGMNLPAQSSAASVPDTTSKESGPIPPAS
jgi:hypothetical protein